MVIFLTFLLVGLTVLILILKFEKKQTAKINTVLKETRGIPPLFMLKATEQKIKAVKAALQFDDKAPNMATAGSMANIYANPISDSRQTTARALKLLSASYNNGQISLEAYNLKLDELLEQATGNRGAIGLAS